MRFLRDVVLLAVAAVVCVLAYNYWSGNGLTLSTTSPSGVNVEKAGKKGAEIVSTASEKGREAAAKLEGALNEGALTTKIKSKMALDDHVKARTIGVDTDGSVVTLTGTVGSIAERDRAVRLATETDGVSKVVDRLLVK
ncbi:MAG: BON domain-containing protein [Acidobacteriota bacterium]